MDLQNNLYKQLILVRNPILICALLTNGAKFETYFESDPLEYETNHLFVCSNDVRRMLREYKAGTLLVPAQQFSESLTTFHTWRSGEMHEYEEAMKARKDGKK